MGPDRVPGGTWTRIGSLRAVRRLRRQRRLMASQPKNSKPNAGLTA